MKRPIFSMFFLLLALFYPYSLSSEIQRCSDNDTVVSNMLDENNLMNYLKGDWSVQGTWTIVEGEGHIKSSINAKLSGNETFTPTLKGHFLQKNLTAQMRYRSRNQGAVIQEKFSAMTMLTFNKNIKQFIYWYFDCSGSFVEAKGAFSSQDQSYTFQYEAQGSSGEPIEMRYIIKILDKNKYQWQVLQKREDQASYEEVALGVSKRQKS